MYILFNNYSVLVEGDLVLKADAKDEDALNEMGEEVLTVAA